MSPIASMSKALVLTLSGGVGSSVSMAEAKGYLHKRLEVPARASRATAALRLMVASASTAHMLSAKQGAQAHRWEPQSLQKCRRLSTSSNFPGDISAVACKRGWVCFIDSDLEGAHREAIAMLILQGNNWLASSRTLYIPRLSAPWST